MKSLFIRLRTAIAMKVMLPGLLILREQMIKYDMTCDKTSDI